MYWRFFRECKKTLGISLTENTGVVYSLSNIIESLIFSSPVFTLIAWRSKYDWNRCEGTAFRFEINWTYNQELRVYVIKRWSNNHALLCTLITHHVSKTLCFTDEISDCLSLESYWHHQLVPYIVYLCLNSLFNHNDGSNCSSTLSWCRHSQCQYLVYPSPQYADCRRNRTVWNWANIAKNNHRDLLYIRD